MLLKEGSKPKMNGVQELMENVWALLWWIFIITFMKNWCEYILRENLILNGKLSVWIYSNQSWSEKDHSRNFQILWKPLSEEASQSIVHWAEVQRTNLHWDNNSNCLNKFCKWWLYLYPLLLELILKLLIRLLTTYSLFIYDEYISSLFQD